MEEYEKRQQARRQKAIEKEKNDIHETDERIKRKHTF